MGTHRSDEVNYDLEFPFMLSEDGNVEEIWIVTALEKYKEKEWVYIVSAHFNKEEALTKLRTLRKIIPRLAEAYDNDTANSLLFKDVHEFEEIKNELLILNPNLKKEKEIGDWEWEISYGVELLKYSEIM
jgi:hypothetical protein